MYLLIVLDTLLLRPSLHLLHFLSFKTYTQIHFTSLSFGLTPFKIPAAQFHLTPLHLTCLHFTALLDDFRHTSIPFISPGL